MPLVQALAIDYVVLWRLGRLQARSSIGWVSTPRAGADRQVDALKRYKKAMDAVAVTLRSIVFYVCIAGEAANEWARRNGEIPQAGLPILRLGLAELAHHYGYAKIPAEREEAGAG
jgi:hypothetical protein